MWKEKVVALFEVSAQSFPFGGTENNTKIEAGLSWLLQLVW
jgi:hypothetical protein